MNKTKKSAAPKKTSRRLKKSGKSAAQLDREIAEALARNVGGLPMVQVRMENGRPQVQAPPSPPQKSTVTVLTVTQIYPHSSESTHKLTLVFANRERALAAIRAHLTNHEASTTINIRTLDVIS